MAVYAILRPNRVIRGQTTDPTVIAPDETAQLWPNPHDVRLNGNWWVLSADGQSTSPATNSELDEARVDPIREATRRQAEMQELRDAGQALLQDPLVLPSVKRFVRALRALT